jgi:hypothetical protein
MMGVVKLQSNTDNKNILILEKLKDLCVQLNIERPKYGEITFIFQDGKIIDVIKKDRIRLA